MRSASRHAASSSRSPDSARAAAPGSVSQPARASVARDVGVARDRHPRLAPDQVEHALARQRRRRRVERRERLVELRRRARAASRSRPKIAPNSAIEPRVVVRVERMRDDHVRHERARRVDVLAPVLVDVDDEMRRRQRAQRARSGSLVPPTFGTALHARRADARRSRCARRRASPRPSANSSSVRLGTRHAMRGARAARGCTTPAQSAGTRVASIRLPRLASGAFANARS